MSFDRENLTRKSAVAPIADEDVIVVVAIAWNGLGLRRLLLALRYNDDRPAREIAAMIGSPSVFHVYRRLGSVLAVLKGALLRRGVDEPRP